MFRAVERVRERLLLTTAALERAGVAYAVIVGNAVAAWVAQANETAVRNTPDVDLLVRRCDLDQVKAALASAGFMHGDAAGTHGFLEAADPKPREAVQITFAGEKVRHEDSTCASEVEESEPVGHFRVLQLDALVRMKLTSNRLKDKVHLLDLIGVGLIDATWPSRLPPELAERLQTLLDNPDG